VVNTVLQPMTVAAAWALLDQVPDPELPMLSVVDLGIVREVALDAGHCHVTLTPTYSGCPATAAIAAAVRARMLEGGAEEVSIATRIAPPWTSDWISEKGRRALLAHGIAPPGQCAASAETGRDQLRPVHTEGLFAWRQQEEPVACPRCGSADTRLVSRFGSTACKALYQCRACREPFDHFKPH
jgi:ring-1,2-phenylacetyl-CoA epoxidase subunit PaaD